MRIALVLLVVLAVVLPTALIPRAATGSENVYSSRQVLQAFRAAGLPLHRAGSDQQNFGRRSFAGTRGKQLSVTVFAPGSKQIFVTGWTGEPPKSTGLGNVVVVWGPFPQSGESARIHAALDRLTALAPR